MYRYLYNDMGQGTDEILDTDLLCRMFLEFCLNGDLWQYYDRYEELNKKVNESKMRAMFHYLARVTHVLKAGTGDLGDGQVLALTEPGELVYLDLKPGNVLIGGRLNDQEHNDRPAFKVSIIRTSSFSHNSEILIINSSMILASLRLLLSNRILHIWIRKRMWELWISFCLSKFNWDINMIRKGHGTECSMTLGWRGVS